MANNCKIGHNFEIYSFLANNRLFNGLSHTATDFYFAHIIRNFTLSNLIPNWKQKRLVPLQRGHVSIGRAGLVRGTEGVN